MFTYEKMQVWQDAKTLAVDIYKLTANFPKEEKYGLTDQIRRAVISVSSNIAEGAGRSSTKEKQHFIHIAYGSLMEINSQLSIATELEMLTTENYNRIRTQITGIARQLSALNRKLSND